MIPIKDTIPRQNPPIATWILIFVNGVVFFFELTMPPQVLEQFFHLFGIVPARYTHPDWAAWVGFPIDNYWPFLTSMFLHGGWLHIIGNMWALWIFGDNVEDRMGPFALRDVLRALWNRRRHHACTDQPAIDSPERRRLGSHRRRHGRVLRPLPAGARDRSCADPVLAIFL